MIIELGEGIMTILVILTILLMLGAPELMLVFVVVGIISIVGFSTTGKELTIKSKDNIILQLNMDQNTTIIDVEKVE